MKKNNPDMKKRVGERFRQFRKSLGKKQGVMGREFQTHQSTITNIEVGKTFPKISYLYRLYSDYRLNLNWLIGDDPDMLLKVKSKMVTVISLLPAQIPEDDYRYEKYLELLGLMMVPEVEQVIWGKLQEAKILFKEAIDRFKENCQ